MPKPSDNEDNHENSVNDIEKFFKFRRDNTQKTIIGYYNINSLRNKFADIKEIVSKSMPDILVIAETKLDSSFPNKQFVLKNYYEPIRRDTSAHSGGLIEYVRNGIIRKSLTNLELKTFESIASEITICKNKWFVLSFYRTERNESKKVNIERFLKELTTILNDVFKKYDNVLLMGDINIDMHDKKCVGYNELNNLMNIFGLKNLIKDKTCFFKGHESSIDIMLTNNPNKFYKSQSFELGCSDCHKIVTTSLKAHVPRLKSKKISYRCMRNFDKEAFHQELSSNILNKFELSNTNDSYNLLLEIVSTTINKHSPIKTKMIRGNQSRFMNKKLSKAIMKRSALKSKYNKNSTPLNRQIFKKQRNLCVALKNESIKKDFENATANLKHNSKAFYKVLNPYLSNKSGLSGSDITLVEGDRIITDDSEIVHIFNDFYINIVKYSSGASPKSVADNLPPGSNLDKILTEISKIYQNHPSIKSIKGMKFKKRFSLKRVSVTDVLKILNKINTKKATGFDNIPPKIIKEAAHILAKPLTDIINLSLFECIFPNKAKISSTLPFFKKGDRTNKSNYRPVSVLSIFSKVFEKVIQTQVSNYSDNFLSKYISAYRKNYSCQHVLIRLLEEWKYNLDNNNLVGSVLMDLSKAFDCIPHDLLIAKMEAYGFERNARKYIYSYLKGRRQCVKLNGTYSKFQTILAGVPQGSILGPIIFNIFINDLYFIFETANLHGFADDHTLSAESKNLNDLKLILCNESDKAIDWLNSNKMMVNPSKFQAIIFKKNKENIITSLKIKDKEITTTDSVELLGIKIDNKLKFDEHIIKLCKKSTGLLNSLFRLRKFITGDAKKLAVNSFVISNFNYCPLIWHFSSYRSINTIEMIQKRALKFINENSNLDYYTLLGNLGLCTMKVKRLRTLCLEIFKTLNGLNPNYMKEIFKTSNLRRSERLKFNLEVQKHNQVTFGKKSLTALGPILWNSLPNHIKSLTKLSDFKKFIQSWGNKDCPNYRKLISYYEAI